MSKSWPLVALGEVLKQVSRSEKVDPTKKYRLLGVRLDGQGPFIRETKLGSQSSATQLYQVQHGDFIYSRLFAWRGAFGVIGTKLDGCYVSNEFPTFKPHPDRLDVAFLRFWFQLPTSLAVVEADCTGSTPLTRNRFKESFFLNLKIPLPNLAEQQRIVARIEKLAAKIKEARGVRWQTVEEAKALINSTSRQLFCTSANHKTAPFATVCADIIDCLHSNAIYADTGIPTLRSPDIGWGKLFPETALKTSEEEYLRRTRRGELLPNDIIIVREGGGTGKAGIVEEGQKMSLGQRVMQVRPDSRKILPQYLLYQWLSPTIQQDQIVPFSKGSASPHLNIGAIKKFPLVLPPLEEQRRVVTYLDKLQAKVDSLKRLQTETAAELDAMMPSILDKAFKGEL